MTRPSVRTSWSGNNSISVSPIATDVLVVFVFNQYDVTDVSLSTDGSLDYLDVADSDGDARLELWMKATPTAGSQTLTATAAGGTTWIMCVAVQDAKLNDPNGGTASAKTTFDRSDSLTVSITSVSNALVLYGETNSNHSAAYGTEHWNTGSTLVAFSGQHHVSKEDAAGSGNDQDYSYVESGVAHWAGIAIEINSALFADMSGTLTMSGSLSRTTNKALSGVLTFIGGVEALIEFLAAFIVAIAAPTQDIRAMSAPSASIELETDPTADAEGEQNPVREV